ncbi:MAG TPA: hypothetical protein VKE69_11935, partial [Planctomycetota bacterium]|nr:hypothetical protein [Planctomycetota bacterium]
ALVDWVDLELLLGIGVDDEYALREAVPKLAHAREIPILLPLGADGALLATAERTVRFETTGGRRPWNSIGLRETLLGALAWRLGEGSDLVEATRFGCAAAVAKLRSDSPVRADLREIDDLLPSVHLHDSASPR